MAFGPSVVALFICVHQLTLHGALGGILVPGEAPLPSAVALARGVFPYSGFSFAGPPGIVLALLPLGLLSHVVATNALLSLARLLTVAVTVGAVYLAGVAAKPYGVPASGLAGVLSATYTLGFLSSDGVTVGPYVAFFTLLAISLAFRDGALVAGRRLAWAGIVFGFACTLRPWALVPSVVFLACTAAAGGGRPARLGRAAGGFAAGIVVPCLPFLLEAPAGFVRGAILAELPGHGVEATGRKLADLLGLSGAAGVSHASSLSLVIAALVVAIILLTALLGFSSSSTFDWFVAMTGTGVIAAALLPGAMSLGYGDYAFPLIAVAVAVTACRLTGLLAASWSGRGTDVRGSLSSALAILIVGCAVVLTAVTAPADGRYAGRYAARHGAVVRGILDAKIPAGACAVSDDAAILLAADRFDANGSSCPAVTDPAALVATGTVSSAEAHWATWLEEAKYVVLTAGPRPFSTHSAAGSYFTGHYALVAARPAFTVYVKTGTTS